jgi:NADH-quinone oxidoreductase subunit A
MLANYFPILIFIGIGLFVGVAFIGIGLALAPNRPDEAKLSPYECGFEAFSDARSKFDVRFYLVAILFIIFDLEIAFCSPGPWCSTRLVCLVSGQWCCFSAC